MNKHDKPQPPNDPSKDGSGGGKPIPPPPDPGKHEKR